MEGVVGVLVVVVEVVVEMMVGVVVVGRNDGTGHASGGGVPGFRRVSGASCRKPTRFPAYLMGDVPKLHRIFGTTPLDHAENLARLGRKPARFSA